ncbi:MAG TPA: CapA family protein [Anaerolineales bacterium]|nr:CapA family protein [Anaerolineales bacterium]
MRSNHDVVAEIGRVTARRRNPKVAGIGLCLALLSGCAQGQAPEMTAVESPPDPSPTPFLPSTATPTPETVSVWIAPSVPPEARGLFLDSLSILGWPVLVAQDESAASVRLVPDGGMPFARWTYALVAPFPTVEDSFSIEEFGAEWRGEAENGWQILVTPSVRTLLEARLGSPGPEVIEAPAGFLVDQAWESRPSLSLVPFESLGLRWKVLEVEGQSPIRKDFDPASYPFDVVFGLEGDPGTVSRIAEALGLPENVSRNRRSDRLTTVVVTGVTALTRATAWRMEARGVNYPAELIGAWLSQADITHISNEVSFKPDCPPPTGNLNILLFCSLPGHIALLETVGADVVELTGNHVLDAGRDAFMYSMDLYEARGWPTFGGGRNLSLAGKPALFEHNGNRFAFLGCNEAGPPGAWARDDSPGAMPCGEDRLLPEIGALRGEGYLPFFTFQWHEHYVPFPYSNQREVFRAAAQAGAAVVSGSQAHQPMGFEFEGESLVHYGLGNLFFDQMWSQSVRQEFIDRYVVYEGRVVSLELLTAVLEDWAQPRPMTPAERTDFLDMIFSASGW